MSHLRGSDDFNAPSLAPLRDPPRFAAPDGTWRAIERRLASPPPRRFPIVAGMALSACAAIAIGWGLRARAPHRPSPSPLATAALRIHRERLRGALAFELCDGSPQRVQSWICAEAGLETPASVPWIRGGDACAAIVDVAGEPAAVLAYDGRSAPMTMVTARTDAAGAGARPAARYRDPASGITLVTWFRSDQAFVLVSGTGGPH